MVIARPNDRVRESKGINILISQNYRSGKQISIRIHKGRSRQNRNTYIVAIVNIHKQINGKQLNHRISVEENNGSGNVKN